MSTNTHLKKLIIRGKPHIGISVVGDREIALLANCKYLTALDVSGNTITDQGAIALAKNTSIRYLNVSYCKIGMIGLYAFLNNDTLISLQHFNRPNYQENAQIISNEEIKQLLALAEINLSPLILEQAFQGNREKKVEILHYFNQHFKTGYVIENCAKWFTDNDSIDIKKILLKELFSVWKKKMTLREKDNQAKSDDAYGARLEFKRNLKALEEQAMKAIESGDIETLSTIIPKLPHGVNASLKYEGTLLTYCLDKNQVQAAEFLMDHGACIEIHEYEKTPFFEASESGNLPFVKLFLRRGSNITGEFYFNAETAFSIAAFKLNYSVIRLLNQYLHLTQNFPKPIKNLPDEHIQKWDMIFRNSNVTPWESFGKDEDLLMDYSKNALVILHNLGKNKEIEEKAELKEAKNYAEIYRLIHDKIAILKRKKPQNIQSYFNTLQGQKCYQSIPLVNPSLNRPLLTKEELGKILLTLNKELTQQKEIDIDWSAYPQLFIAQYRCIHYYEHFFDDFQRLDHAYTSHLGRMAPAPAVFSMSSLSPAEHQLARESTILKNAFELRVLFDRFFQTGDFTHQRKTYPSLGHFLQERMSNEYDGYQDDIKKRKQAAYEILDDLMAHGYPHYASSDLIDHTLRYGYGLKKIASLARHRLRPQYEQNGKPRYPILGKIFIGLFTPFEMAKVRARHAAGMHNRKELDLRDPVVPERETSITGGAEAGYVFYEECLDVPDFSQWGEDYPKRFGMNEDKNKFNDFKTRLNNPSENKRASVETEIIEYVKAHKERELLILAQEEARRRHGYLVYRPYDRNYALEPEPIRYEDGRVFSSKHDRHLMGTTGQQRFDHKKSETTETQPESSRYNESFSKAAFSSSSQIYPMQLPTRLVLKAPNFSSFFGMYGQSKIYKTTAGNCFESHVVESDGNCGYTAFGIERKDAYQFLKKNINQVQHLLTPVIREELVKERFINYLVEHHLAGAGLLKLFTDRRTRQKAGLKIDDLDEEIFAYAADVSMIGAYLDYDVRDKQVDVGWSHPCVLQALAHIREIQLTIWIESNRQLNPHKDYHQYTPPGSTESKHLLFVNGNHFELLVESLAHKNEKSKNSPASSFSSKPENDEMDVDTDLPVNSSETVRKRKERDADNAEIQGEKRSKVEGDFGNVFYQSFSNSKLKALLAKAIISLDYLQSREIVQIFFKDPDDVKEFQAQLLRIGIGHSAPSERGRPRKTDYSKNDDTYLISLSSYEYNAITGDEDAYAKLVSVTSSSNNAPAGATTRTEASAATTNIKSRSPAPY